MYIVYPVISSLKVQLGQGQNLVYTAYKLFWAHKYYSHYKEICEHFILHVYTLIFLTECNCMSEEAFKFIEEHGSYYLTKEGMYIRMYGCSRAPSLLPKYATDYVVHNQWHLLYSLSMPLIMWYIKKQLGKYI